LILIDTSAWVDFFRGRKGSERVDELLESDAVALCGPVITELRRGLRSAAERRKVLPLLEACHLLDEPDDLWSEAGDLGFVLARKGVTVKTLDLLIAIYALKYNVPVLTSDADFAVIKDAGILLLLA